MSRRNIQFYPGGYYHIFNRGCDREPIFRSNENYVFLLQRVKKYFEPNIVTVIAYCLMPNHYHFLLRQEGEKPVGDLIQLVFNSYSKAFNKMYNRKGTLFEGKYKSIRVDEENYLIHLCRYIHRNPLEAGLVSDLKDWAFSNYLEWIDKRKGSLVDRAFVQSRFPSPLDYQQFVLEYSPPKKVQEGLGTYLFD